LRKNIGEEKYYTTTQISKALGISMESLRDWLLREYIAPSVPSQGQGKKAFFTFNDVLGIRFFQELLRIGFARKIAAEILRKFTTQTKSLKGQIPSQALFNVYGDWVDAHFDRLKPIGAPREKLLDELKEIQTRMKEHKETPQDLMNKYKIDSVLDNDIGPYLIGYAQAREWDFIHIVNIDRIYKDVEKRLQAL
jgi:DNA-binding transcriptional MerR regulator